MSDQQRHNDSYPHVPQQQPNYTALRFQPDPPFRPSQGLFWALLGLTLFFLILALYMAKAFLLTH
jgi:hypothetical protein